jgi:DNA/RNA-binding domain of Phe-tRNA-synthetase-like protein
VSHPPYQFWVDSRAEEIGVRFLVAILTGLEIRKKEPELERWRRAIQKELMTVDIDADARLAGYRPVLAAAGNPTAIASPEYLFRLLHRVGTLPRINTCVDAYNTVSVSTRAVASVHDLHKLSGTVRMVRLSESQTFYPLGRDESEEIMPAGEFGARDDRHMLCRLNCKQSRLSSIDETSRDVLVYVQGNPALEGASLAAALEELCDTVLRFNGGTRLPVEQVSPPDL